jgi:hypothetical protein
VHDTMHCNLSLGSGRYNVARGLYVQLFKCTSVTAGLIAGLICDTFPRCSVRFPDALRCPPTVQELGSVSLSNLLDVP